MQEGIPGSPTLRSAGGSPKRLSPKIHTPHTARVRKPSHTLKSKPQVSTGTPKTRAAPAVAESPGECDVLIQHRLHHGHRGGGSIDVCGGGTTRSPAIAIRPDPQVPAPSNPALVRTLAAPLEFKPQPPPCFPALLPTETRRDH